MIPTIYGLKLINHIQLGSSSCIHFHDLNSTSPVSKWLKVPGYSNNVKLAISSELQDAIGRLAVLCFIQPLTCSATSHLTKMHLKSLLASKTIRSDTFPYTPLTYYYVFHSMLKRCVWAEGALESLFLSSVAPPLQLTWRTVKAWMEGKPVLMFSITSSQLQKCFTNEEITYELFLVPAKYCENQCQCLCYSPQQMYLNWQCIDDLYWNTKNKSLTRAPCRGFGLSGDSSSFSILLAKDHGFDPNARFYITDICMRSFSAFKLFAEFTTREVKNLNPYAKDALPEVNEEETANLYVFKCSEWENRYEVDIGFRLAAAHNMKGEIYSFFGLFFSI